jgi:MSHA biogenesis protein MshK
MMPLRLLALALAGLAMLGAAGLARAQDAGLRDPTRPPAVLAAPVGTPGQDGVPGEPQLQSILVSLRPGGRRVAVIDGKTLRQGDRIDGALVETIRPTEVVLRKGKQRQILKLFRPPATGAAV